MMKKNIKAKSYLTVFLIILLLFINIASAKSTIPRYIPLQITQGKTFTGADNFIFLTNNTNYTAIDWYGAFSLPKDIKIWSASSAGITPLKTAGANIRVSPLSWNKIINPGESIHIEFNSSAEYNQTVTLNNMYFVGKTEKVYDKEKIPATEDVLIIVKKREVAGGYYSIQKNVINVYNNFFRNKNVIGDEIRQHKYNIVLLIPMIELKTIQQEEDEYTQYLSQDFMRWAIKGLAPESNVDYSTVENVKKYLNSPNLKYIYYVGDGGMMTCSGIECTDPYDTKIWDAVPNLTASDVSKIQFNEEQVWILNACHGILGSFPLALYKSGLRHYTAGATSLYQPFDSDLGAFAFANVLEGLSLSDALKKAGAKVSKMYYNNPAMFKGYGYLFNGVWGVVDGTDNCYLLDILSPKITEYNKEVIMPKAPTLESWPFQWFSY